jgi:anti-sigma B factor antagonist
MITEFSIKVEETHNIPTINVSGEIDIYTCSELREVIKHTLQKGATSFILDFQNIHYIDSTGLGTIAHSAQQVEEKNGTIYVLCSKPQIKKIFEVSGLQKKNISLYENKSELPKSLTESGDK